jgi:hypothetical protein
LLLRKFTDALETNRKTCLEMGSVEGCATEILQGNGFHKTHLQGVLLLRSGFLVCELHDIVPAS